MSVENTRMCALKKLMEYDFTLYDLALYLDTHPFDEDALDVYQELKKEALKLRDSYEHKFGPLTKDNAATECEWKWINNPWPWERMV